MSTCIDQNYNTGIIHNHSPFYKPVNNGTKVNIGTSDRPLVITYLDHSPPNAKNGDMYFNTKTEDLKMFDGSKWQTIGGNIFEHVFVDNFDIVTENSGFYKVKLYQDVNSGKRGVIIEKDNKLFIDETNKAIDFIKDNLPKGYLWVEKRIMDHLS